MDRIIKNLHEDTTSGGGMVLENLICVIQCMVGNNRRALDHSTHQLRPHLIPNYCSCTDQNIN